MRMSLEQVSWLGMRFSVPREWEIVRHSVDPAVGLLVFRCRRDDRLVLSWARRSTAIDLDRLLRDYRSRDVADERGVSLGPVCEIGPWRSYAAGEGGQERLRAVRFLPREQRAFEVFFAGGPGDAAAREAFFSSFEVARAGEPVQKWRAFDLEVEVPAEWSLENVAARPADLTFLFRKPGAEVSVRRLKLPELWHFGDLEKFLRRDIGLGEARFLPCSHGEHRSCEAESREAGTRFQAWLGKLTRRHDLAWYCERSRALYLKTARGAGDGAALVGQCKVCCCEAAADAAPKPVASKEVVHL